MTSGCRQVYPVILGAHTNVWSCTCHISSHLKAGCAIHSPPSQERGRKQWECTQGFQQVLKGKEENKVRNTVISWIDFRALISLPSRIKNRKSESMSIMQKKTECRSTEGILDNFKDILHSLFRLFKFSSKQISCLTWCLMFPDSSLFFCPSIPSVTVVWLSQIASTSNGRLLNTEKNTQSGQAG